MAITQNGRIELAIKSTLANVIDLSTVADTLAKLWEWPFANGVGANQANMLWHDTRTLSAGASEDLDFSGAIGSPAEPLVDGLGAAVALTRIKALFIKAATANVGDLQVSRPAADGIPIFVAAGDGAVVTPGGCLLLIFPDADGIAVSASAGLITVTNPGAGSADYDLVILGTT